MSNKSSKKRARPLPIAPSHDSSASSSSSSYDDDDEKKSGHAVEGPNKKARTSPLSPDDVRFGGKVMMIFTVDPEQDEPIKDTQIIYPHYVVGLVDEDKNRAMHDILSEFMRLSDPDAPKLGVFFYTPDKRKAWLKDHQLCEEIFYDNEPTLFMRMWKALSYGASFVDLYVVH